MLEWILSLFKKKLTTDDKLLYLYSNGYWYSMEGDELFVSRPKYIEPYTPQYETTKSAGMDIKADVDNFVVIPAASWKLIPTGLYLAEGFNNIEIPLEVQVRSRSGLALKKGLFVLNAPGTVDQDYPGEICVILANMSDEDVTVNQGERIAQLVISSVVKPDPAKFIKNKVRESGFGSTGK